MGLVELVLTIIGGIVLVVIGAWFLVNLVAIWFFVNIQNAFMGRPTLWLRTKRRFRRR